MANDKRLPYSAEAADAGLAVPVLGSKWGMNSSVINEHTGKIEFHRQLLPYSSRGSVDRANGNHFTRQMRIRSTDFFKACSCILGWSETGGPGSSLLRRLPIRDEEGLGMIATRIPGYRFHGSSEIKPGDSNVAPKQPGGRVPGSAVNPALSALFKDDAYTSPDVFDFSAGTGWAQAGIKQTRYCVLDVEYSHVPYLVRTDAQIQSASNIFGQNSEILRHMWAEFVPSIEYTTSKALTLKFGPGASGTLPGTPCSTESGYVRSTGELVVHWIGVPFNAVNALFKKFENQRYGSVNYPAFSINMFGGIKTYLQETLLFMTCRSELRMQPHGVIEYDLHYHFNYREGGWNNFLTNNGPAFEPVVRISDNSTPYRRIDFLELFKHLGV